MSQAKWITFANEQALKGEFTQFPYILTNWKYSLERNTIDKKNTQQGKTSKTDGKTGGSIKIRNKILHCLRNLAVGTNCTTRLRRKVRAELLEHFTTFPSIKTTQGLSKFAQCLLDHIQDKQLARLCFCLFNATACIGSWKCYFQKFQQNFIF